jgi:predicted glycosyl hydrolase (DUF1957 family)
MHNKLNKRYSNYMRWQVFSEYEIKMDDTSDQNVNNLVEMGRQYIEELYAMDSNFFNKLLEKLENVNRYNQLTFYEN